MAGTRKLTVEILGDARGVSGALAQVEEKTGRMHGAFSALSVAGGQAFAGLGQKALEFGGASIKAASDLAETESKVKVIFGTMAEASAVSTEQVMADKTALEKAEKSYAEATEAAASKTGKARDTAVAKAEEWRQKVTAAQNKVAENDRLNAEAHEKFMKSGAKLSDEFAKEIEKFASKAAKNYGQSKQQAMDAAASFATFGKAAGLNGKELVDFSTKLTGLSSDMASFSNTTPDEAIEAIGAALRGESEPIRKYGVLLNDASIKAKAMEMGLYKGTGALDAQAKTMATYQLILDKTKDAQGDFGRTSDGLANKQRIMAAQMDNLKVSLGEKLLPVQLAVTSGLLKMIDVVSSLGPVIGKVISVVEEWGGKLKAAVMPVVDEIVAQWKDKWDEIQAVAGVAWDGIVAVVTGYITILKGEIRAGLDLVRGIFKVVMDLVHGDWSAAWDAVKETGRKLWGDIRDIGRELWDSAPDSIKNVITGVLGTVKDWIGNITGDVTGAWSTLWDSLKKAFGDDGPWGVVRGVAVEGLATVKRWVSGIGTELGDAWSGIWDALSNVFSGAWNTITETVTGAFDWVKIWVSNIGGSVAAAWRDTVWNPLSATFTTAWAIVKGVVEPALNAIGTVFGGIARAVEGLIGWLGKINWPDPPGWMKSIIDKGGDILGGFADWVKSNPASASPAPSSGAKPNVQTAKPPTTTASAPPGAPTGAKAGNTFQDTDGVTWTADGSGGWATGTPTGTPAGGDPGITPPDTSPFGSYGQSAAAAGFNAAGNAATSAGSSIFAGFGGDSGDGGSTTAVPVGTTAGGPTSGGANGPSTGEWANNPNRAPSRSWKDNNPGNIIWGPFAKRMGATGPDADGRFAVFPTYEAGRNALRTLLSEGPDSTDWKYRDLTIAEALAHYAPGFENDTQNYIDLVTKFTGKPASTKVGSLDEAGLTGLMDAIQRVEGWNPAAATGSPAGGTAANTGDYGPTQYPTPTAVSTSAWGNPNAVWEQRLARVSAQGHSFRINEKVADRFVGLFNDLGKYGYNIHETFIKPGGASLGFIQTYNVRHIANDASKGWSNHSFGFAADINPDVNPYGATKWDIPTQLAHGLAKKWGLRWGGDYTSSAKDAMHFEYAGSPESLGYKPMADGGYLNEPTAILAGEAGPEAILPLTNPLRMAQVLNDPRVFMPIMDTLMPGFDPAMMPALGAAMPGVIDPAMMPFVAAMMPGVIPGVDPLAGSDARMMPGSIPSAAPETVSIGTVVIADGAVDAGRGGFGGSTGNRGDATGPIVDGSAGNVVYFDNLIGNLQVVGSSISPAQGREIARLIYTPLQEMAASKGHVTVNGGWRIDAQ